MWLVLVDAMLSVMSCIVLQTRQETYVINGRLNQSSMTQLLYLSYLLSGQVTPFLLIISSLLRYFLMFTACSLCQCSHSVISHTCVNVTSSQFSSPIVLVFNTKNGKILIRPSSWGRKYACMGMKNWIFENSPYSMKWLVVLLNWTFLAIYTMSGKKSLRYSKHNFIKYYQIF